MKLSLTATRGPLKGKIYEFLEYNRISIGRSPNAYFSLSEDTRISRIHCLLELSEGVCFIKDLNSSNGTFHGIYDSKIKKVKFVKIKEAHIKNNEYIAVGQTVFKLSVLGDTSPKLTPSVKSRQKIEDNSIIGNFKIVKELGRGGIAFVYLVKYIGNRNIEQPFALKIVYPHVSPQDNQIKRFLRECEYGSEIRHKNLVRYYKSGYSHIGFFYVPMEFIEGNNLEQHIKKQYLEVDNFKNIALNLIDGLEHLHENKIIHRDLKPQNIMVLKNGNIKIIDFGLAKNFEECGLSGLTLSNRFIGTPAYAPPEQICNAKSVGIPADIYSLGATFYFMLTKKPPFVGGINEILIKVITEYPLHPFSINPKIPQKLANIVMTCLEKDVSNRFPCLRTLKNEIVSL